MQDSDDSEEEEEDDDEWAGDPRDTVLTHPGNSSASMDLGADRQSMLPPLLAALGRTQGMSALSETTRCHCGTGKAWLSSGQ